MIRLNGEQCNPPLAWMSELTPSEREAIFRRLGLGELFEKTQDAKRTIGRCDKEANALVERLFPDIPNHQRHI